MTKMKIGVQLYTLRKYLKSPSNVPEVFEKVKQTGAETVQVSGMCKMDAAVLKRIADDNGLSICITHVPYLRLVNDLPALVEEHEILNCKNIGIGMMPSKFRGEGMDGIKRFCDFLNGTAAALSKEGMTMNYHNHNFEFKKAEGKVIYDYMIDNTDPTVQFIPDTFWIKVGGADPIKYIEKLSGRINTLHLKDYSRFGTLGIMRPIGEGNLNFKEILAVAEAANVQNAVVELDFAKKPYYALKRSLDYIKTVY